MSSKKWLLVGFGIILLITLSFGLGYLSGRGAEPAPIIIEKCSE